MYRLILVMESRIRRNVYVRFGGEYLETYCSNTTTRRILSLLDIVDGSRVGIMGWSHGGMITLMNLFNYPKPVHRRNHIYIVPDN